MKWTVVGYWGGFPGKGEATSGYLLEEDGFSLLFDCGSGVLSQLQHYIPISRLDAVCLSHYHHDHIADLGPLQYARLVACELLQTNQPLSIYGHRGEREHFERLTYRTHTIGIAYDPDQTLTIGPFRISFLKTLHPVLCYAMRIEAAGKTIVYTADTAYFDALAYFAKGADLLVSECSLYKEQNGQTIGHMNAAEAGTVARKANCRHLLLTHLPHFGNHRQLLQTAKSVFPGDVSLAESGWTWGCK